jgi:hypothetical protein
MEEDETHMKGPRTVHFHCSEYYMWQLSGNDIGHQLTIFARDHETMSPRPPLPVADQRAIPIQPLIISRALSEQLKLCYIAFRLKHSRRS